MIVRLLSSALIAMLFSGVAAAQTATVTAPPAAVAPAVAAPVADRLARIKASGVLRVGTTGDYKPYTYLDPATQTYSGFDIDAARALASSLGVKVTFVATTWPTMTSDLLADKFDVAMGGVSDSPEREAHGVLSTAYLTDGKVALVRAVDRDKYKTLASIDQPGVRIAVNPGGTNATFVGKTFKVATVTVVDKNLSIPQLVANGSADVMVTDGVEAALAARADPRLAVADPAHPFTTLVKAYYLPAGDASYVAAVNAFVTRALHDGTYARLRAEWIS